jgi:excisionase family DNA binding protein
MNGVGPTDDAQRRDWPLLLTVEDVSRLLGVSVRSVWRMVRTGQCPEPLRVRGSTRWRRGELEKWVAAGCPAVREMRGTSDGK